MAKTARDTKVRGTDTMTLFADMLHDPDESYLVGDTLFAPFTLDEPFDGPRLRLAPAYTNGQCNKGATPQRSATGLPRDC